MDELNNLAVRLIGYLESGYQLNSETAKSLLEGLKNIGMDQSVVTDQPIVWTPVDLVKPLLPPGKTNPRPEVDCMSPEHPVNDPTSPHYDPRMLGLPVTHPEHPFCDPNSPYCQMGK